MSTDVIIATSSVVIGLAALLVSEDGLVTLTLVNTGIDPAIVGDYSVRVDGKPTGGWREAVERKTRAAFRAAGADGKRRRVTALLARVTIHLTYGEPHTLDAPGLGLRPAR